MSVISTTLIFDSKTLRLFTKLVKGKKKNPMKVIIHVQWPKKLTGDYSSGQSRNFVCMCFSSSLWCILHVPCIFGAWLFVCFACPELRFSFLSEDQWVSSAAPPDVSNTSAMKDSAVLYLPLCSLLLYWKAFKPTGKNLQTLLGMFVTRSSDSIRYPFHCSTPVYWPI